MINLVALVQNWIHSSAVTETHRETKRRQIILIFPLFRQSQIFQYFVSFTEFSSITYKSKLKLIDCIKYLQITTPRTSTERLEVIGKIIPLFCLTHSRTNTFPAGHQSQLTLGNSTNDNQTKISNHMSLAYSKPQQEVGKLEKREAHSNLPLCLVLHQLYRYKPQVLLFTGITAES